MADVGMIVDGWTADIDPHKTFVDGFEFFFASCEKVVYGQSHVCSSLWLNPGQGSGRSVGCCPLRTASLQTGAEPFPTEGQDRQPAHRPTHHHRCPLDVEPKPHAHEQPASLLDRSKCSRY